MGGRHKGSHQEQPPPFSAGYRFSELSGGILRYGGCGNAMMTNGFSSRDKRMLFLLLLPEAFTGQKRVRLVEEPPGRRHQALGAGACVRPTDEAGAALL
jgi:hypothetical protein